MNIKRSDLLDRLNQAAIGTSDKEVLQQSDCFLFVKKHLITFNDQLMVKTANPLGFDAVVRSKDLLNVIAKLPDDDIEIVLVKGELQVKGKKRAAGIACQTEVHLPIESVPEPAEWSALKKDTLASIHQASLTCGDDITQYLTTMVHVAPKRVEGCDNLRYLRIDGKTGFPSAVLLPSVAVAGLSKLKLTEVSVADGWAHFRNGDGLTVSVRASGEPYFDEELLSNLAEPTKKAEKVMLPENLAEVVSRAEVFQSTEFDARMEIRVSEGKLAITSRREGGWYTERKAIPYSGRALTFEVNPSFLVEALARSREVLVDENKLVLRKDNFTFVASLSAQDEGEKDED